MGYEVIATIKPKAGKEERVREGLHQIAKKVQDHEPNCVKYQVYEHSGSGPTVFHVVEEYATKEAFVEHSSSDDFKALGKAIQEEDLLAEPLSVLPVNQIAGFQSR